MSKKDLFIGPEAGERAKAVESRRNRPTDAPPDDKDRAVAQFLIRTVVDSVARNGLVASERARIVEVLRRELVPSVAVRRRWPARPLRKAVSR